MTSTTEAVVTIAQTLARNSAGCDYPTQGEISIAVASAANLLTASRAEQDAAENEIRRRYGMDTR